MLLYAYMPAAGLWACFSRGAEPHAIVVWSSRAIGAGAMAACIVWYEVLVEHLFIVVVSGGCTAAVFLVYAVVRVHNSMSPTAALAFVLLVMGIYGRAWMLLSKKVAWSDEPLSYDPGHGLWHLLAAQAQYAPSPPPRGRPPRP